MSVEKVNEYKQKKKNRKEIIAKEKRRKKAAKAATWAIGICLIAVVAGGIGLTGYNQYKAYQDALPDYSVSSQVVSDVSGVLDAETEAAETETAEEAAVTEAAETEAAGETAAE